MSRRVLVRNVSPELNQDSLNELFSAFGTVVASTFRLVGPTRNRECVLEFATAEAAVGALFFTGTMLGGQALEVTSVETPNPPSMPTTLPPPLPAQTRAPDAAQTRINNQQLYTQAGIPKVPVSRGLTDGMAAGMTKEQILESILSHRCFGHHARSRAD